MSYKYQYKWIDKNSISLVGKTVAISGATGGIGTCLCDYLAYLGADIVCLDRNAKKSNDLISSLKLKYPQLNAMHISLDLEDFDRVKEVTKQLKDYKVDFLILNAGAYKIPRHKSSTGYNNVFQINFISPYYLACELAQSISERGGRVVAVSSIAHNYSKIDINDIDFSSRNAASKVYGNAKRFLTYSLFEHFYNDETLSIVHPGITFTNITNHYPKLIFAIIKYPMKIIFMKPKKAALCVLYGLFCGCRCNEWIGPKYFNIWGLPKLKKLNTATQDEIINIRNKTNEIIGKLNQ
ncbi:MAG: SDR family NAD(P)-dependent oxidoreductase [Ruminococcaceae bacterium]|nr:SDR family NAD(P)-dependent oxidoreductase [Oscillospiraceae bacterium]